MAERDDLRPGDADLVAYLDGELAPREREAVEKRLARDPDYRARRDALAGGADTIAGAYRTLLAAAPAGELEKMLRSAEAASAGAAPGARAGRPTQRRRMVSLPVALAAALALLILGGAAGWLAARLTAPAPVEIAAAPQNWRTAVADYMSFYSDDTLAVIPDDADLRRRELEEVGARLKLDLTPAAVDLPDLALKRAQLFQFRGMPLAQIAYLSSADGPVAFCIINNGRPDAPPAFEEIDGRNVVYWTSGGRGYMLIGAASREALEALAETLRGRVS